MFDFIRKLTNFDRSNVARHEVIEKCIETDSCVSVKMLIVLFTAVLQVFPSLTLHDVEETYSCVNIVMEMWQNRGCYYAESTVSLFFHFYVVNSKYDPAYFPTLSTSNTIEDV